MMRNARIIFMLPLVFSSAVSFAQDLDTLMQNSDLKTKVQSRSERVVLDETTAAEQARAQAQRRSDYGLELRPGITDSDVGVALRIYLPDRWNKSKLREQLMLVAATEQLRVAALEWQELMQVYRKFCEYRMFQQQLDVFEKELQFLEPHLKQANLDVESNQLAVTDRAKLYSLYLDLVNDQEKVQADQLDVIQELHLLLGADADLNQMALRARVEMPPKTELNALLKRALKNRSDYRQFDAQARSLAAAEAVAESEAGFRLKYIQPSYQVDYNNGKSTAGISASFILPWGTRNPDITVYQQQRALTYSTMELQRIVIEHRLRVLIKSAENYYEQAGQRAETIKPLLTRLYSDLQAMDTGRLEDLRDQLLIRERILDVSLQTTRTICRKEQIAVDLAEELESLVP